MASDLGDEHLISLPGTEWSVWRDALLRSAGFPAAGLDRFAAPECAAVADDFLDGQASRQELESAYDAAAAQGSKVAADIAADPLFREAVCWQNPAMLHNLDRIRDAGGVAPPEEKARARMTRRVREGTIVRYWQRYCGKNDTIGFFGPVAWTRLDPEGPAVRVRCGSQLVRSRDTAFEFWALETYAAGLAADPQVRPWLPVGLHPDLTCDGRRVLSPGAPPAQLTAAEADLLARCDGRTPAAVLTAGPRQREELALLAELADRDIIWWGIDMPYNPEADGVLRATLAAIPDAAARQRAQAGLARLDVARDAVSAAAGDADRLAAALAGLDAEFTAVTGSAPEHRQGQMYAGRRLCYEDTTRDIEVTFGKPILDALAGPLGRVLLPAARWLSATLADAFDVAFGELYDELLSPPDGSPPAGSVPMTVFWDAAQRLFREPGGPVDQVAGELVKRWDVLFDLAHVEPGTARVTVSSEAAGGRVAQLFPPRPPGWRAARIHSPDLHICATSAAAVARGDFYLVLGELHAGWPTLDCALFTGRHPDLASLRAAAAADIGPQFRPLYPTWWPRYTARIAPNLGSSDYQLAFAHAPGADPARLLPITSLAVTRQAGTLTASAADGRSWPAFDVFALLVAWAGLEVLKRTSAGPHTPRLTVDKLVIARETWRTTIGESGMTAPGRVPEYLAARALRRAIGLPDKVFARIGTEVKPVYVDLSSPRYVSGFCTMLRGTQEKAGDDVEIVFTEMLPGTEDAWLPDQSGQGYFSELRIQLVDPLPARGTEPELPTLAP